MSEKPSTGITLLKSAVAYIRSNQVLKSKLMVIINRYPRLWGWIYERMQSSSNQGYDPLNVMSPSSEKIFNTLIEKLNQKKHEGHQ